MPELPEVEMARRHLEATALRQTIRTTEVRDERILAGVSATKFEESLAGKQFHCAIRHGKRLFLKRDDSLWLTLHLGLTGRLVYQEIVVEIIYLAAQEIPEERSCGCRDALHNAAL